MKQKFLLSFCLAASLTVNAADWTGTWATATERSGDQDMPKTTTLSNNALRQTVEVSIGGSALRLLLSNTFSEEPVEILSVYIADAAEGSDINTKTARYLSFNGKRSVTMNGGETVWSDDLSYPLKPLQRLSITINYGSTPKNATGHRGSRTTSYIMSGESSPKKPFLTTEKIEHWYNIATLDVLTEDKPACIAILGNSITDGRGSTTDQQDRWTNIMARQFDGTVGVLNLGIGGNCVLDGGLGPTATERFDRDIMEQHGVTHLIIYEGINDIGGSKQVEKTGRQLIRAYERFIEKAREKGIKVYLGTITPLGNTGYWSFYHEACRQTVNEWMRSAAEKKLVDGILDFDELIRDPLKPTQMRPEWQYDWLHPNAEGYKAMGEYAGDRMKK